MIVARRVGYDSVKNLALIASRGPTRNTTYDPHYAYESYWAGGGWVYKYHKDDRTDRSICGKYKCGLLYRAYGLICARNNQNEERTFKSYCAMVAIDCNGTAGWTLLNKGNCTTDVKTYPIEVTEVMNNVPVYLADYNARMTVIKKKKDKAEAMKQAFKNIRNKARDKARAPPPGNPGS